MTDHSTRKSKTAAGIPPVGFGTYLIADEDAPAAVAAAIAAGYRHIDTAAGYQNEAGVGRGIREGIEAAGLDRSDIFVTTKLWPGNPAWGDKPRAMAKPSRPSRIRGGHWGSTTSISTSSAPAGGSERVNEWRALVDLKAQGNVRSRRE